MPQFNVDDDLAALVEKLAEPRPFEHLSFNSALQKVLIRFAQLVSEKIERKDSLDLNRVLSLDELLAESMALMKAKKDPKKAPSPSAKEWALSVPELKNNKGLSNWQAICSALEIETGGDSARRRLKNWVKEHKPNWPEIPEVKG
jgi:hypothetical protein